MRIPAVVFALAWGLSPPVPGVAQAQDVSLNTESIELCLKTTRGSGGALECVGFATDACVARSDGDPAVRLASCLAAEHAFWDSRLRRAHDMLMGLDKQDDALSGVLGPQAAGRAEALAEMMQAWTAYRDAACDYARAQWGGAKGDGRAMAECAMWMTAEQALKLERLAAER